MRFARCSKATIYSLSALLCVVGCVPEEPWTRERQEQVTIASLAVPPRKALQAADRAVREIDPRATSFEFTANGFRASRQFSAFMVVAAMQGTYVYDVQVARDGAGSRIETRIYSSGSAITAAGVTPTGTSMWQVADAYQLLLDRVRYHSGLTADWVSCEEARSKYNTNGAIEPICLGATARDPAK